MTRTRAPSKIGVQGSSLSLAVVLLLATAVGQSNTTPVNADDIARHEKQALLSELQGLEARAKRLDKPLARATAETEIADAAWPLDSDVAKELLRDAYDHAFPAEEEQAKLRDRPIGAPPVFYGTLGKARATVRRRVLEIARRDKKFADELLRTAIERLGVYEGHMTYSSLAHDALKQGDNEGARGYILQAIDADPTQIAASAEIGRLAANDRAAADEAILHYINRLGSVTLSPRDGSKARVFYLLATLVPFPNANSGARGTTVSPPGPAVMKAYVAYMLQSINQMDPAGITAYRGFLMALWPLLKQHAPELMEQFMDLEQRSRKPGESLSLPSAKSLEHEAKAAYEKRIDRAVDSGQPDEMLIRAAISRGDLSKARKMIDKFADGPLKIQLTEMLTSQQAIGLANKGDISGAQKLAENLVRATSILRVFPIIAGKCVAKKDDACAREVVNQAVKQLKKADVTPEIPPAGIPASIFATSREFDPMLAGLGSLASAVMAVKDELALDVLDELVIAANQSELDTSLGRTGFETSLFKKLAEKNEARVNLAAMQLKDPLRQIVALAAIDQWKSEKLAAEDKLRNTKNEQAGKKN